MLGITQGTVSKAAEKLSSGYKVNRAADDAAGLAISEKMRKQIRGLSQASLNAEDGISAVQTAEGALAEVHDMLQRMNELAVKAANETESESDRQYIQQEVDQLVTEIDRVATTTKFNETYLLKGRDSSGKAGKLNYTTAQTTATTLGAGTIDDKKGTGTIALADASATNGIESGKQVTIDGKTYVYATAVDTDVYSTVAIAVEETKDEDTRVFSSMDDMINQIRQDVDKAGDISTLSAVSNEDNGTVSLVASFFADTNNVISLNLHVGADSSEDNKIKLSLNMMSARGLGINGVRVDGTNDDNATNAIDTIANAIKAVSTQRATLGAVQNRLEHTVKNLDNIVENTQAAESQIRDTDMASEMVKYTNANILAQAGQSMLAQSNQSNQGVLSILG